MEYHFSAYINVYLIAAILCVISAIGLSWRRSSPGSLPFAYLLIALAAWSMFTIFESGATEVRGKLFWSKWQYIGIVSVPTLWLYFVADFTSRVKFFKNKLRFLLWVFPLVTLALAHTNEFHNLIWTDITIPADSPLNIAIYDHGTWFYVFTLFSYASLLLGTVWMIKKFLAFPKRRRVQSIIIIVVMSISWTSNILYVLGFNPLLGLDITPISFSIIALIISWFVFRNQLFDVLPFALNRMVNNMSDGLIVIDPDDIILEINPAALSITGYEGPNPIGMTIWDMFDDFKDQIVPLKGETDLHTEIELAGGSKVLDVKVDSILGEDGVDSGQVITIRDITDKNRIMKFEEEQRRLAEALADTAAAINSSLDLDEVLERILGNVGKVVPHDTANIALMDEKGFLHFVKGIGFDKHAEYDRILTYEPRLEEIPNMREMARNLSPSINANTELDSKWVKVPGSEWIRSYIGAPIHFKGKVLGFINLDAGIPDFFNEDHLPRLQAFADQAAVALQNAQLYEEMQHLAVTDSLTGLFNRRYFFAFVENEIARSKRYEKDLSLIMMDIDQFKLVNDSYGHPVGDQVIKMVAEISLENLRRVDVMCRFGGEEFAVLLPETPKEEAILAAERICRKIEAAKLKVSGDAVEVTVSLGVAGLDDSIHTLNEMIAAADKALYQAKQVGRNCVQAL